MPKKNKNSKKNGTTSNVKTVPCAKNETICANPLSTDNDYFLDEFTKVRRMSLQLYCSPERWGSVLFSAKHYAYVYHDKDVNEDGTPKTPHYHLLLIFENARYRNAVYKLFDLTDCADTTINFQKLKNTQRAFQYLRHNTSEAQKANKHLYSLDEVICDDINFWEDITCPVTTPNEDFVTDLENLSIRDMALRYGRDYIRNYRNYDNFKRTLAFEDRKQTLTEQLTLAERILSTADQLDPFVVRAISQCLGECIHKLCSFEGFVKTKDGLVPSRSLHDVVGETLGRVEDEVYNYLCEVYGE